MGEVYDLVSGACQLVVLKTGNYLALVLSAIPIGKMNVEIGFLEYTPKIGSEVNTGSLNIMFCSMR